MKGVILLAGLGAILPGCFDTKSCTDVHCVDNLTVTLAPENGVWKRGEYELRLQHDGAEASCRFAMPVDLPQGGVARSFDCGAGVVALLAKRTECSSTRKGDAVTQSCTHLEDQYELRLSLRPTPSKLGVELTRDAEVVLKDDREPAYEDSSPNGPGCEPICRVAAYELVVAP